MWQFFDMTKGPSALVCNDCVGAPDEEDAEPFDRSLQEKNQRRRQLLVALALALAVLIIVAQLV